MLLIGNSVTFGFGKINHDGLFAMFMPFVMAFSGWGNCYSLDEGRTQQSTGQGWPVVLLALLLGFAMFAAGMPKLLSGWLNLSSSAVQGRLFDRYYAMDNHDYLATFFVQFHHPFFWEMLDYAVAFFEVFFLVAVFRRAWFRSLLVLAIFFHLANYLILNIIFAANLVIYLLFINWQPLIDFAHSTKLQRYLQILRGHLAFCIALILYTSFVLFRMINYPNPTRNLQGANGNAVANDPMVSLFDLVLHDLHIQLDVNLGLLITAACLVSLF